MLRAGTRDDVRIRMERLGIRASVELRSLEYVCAIGVEVRGARALHGLGEVMRDRDVTQGYDKGLLLMLTLEPNGGECLSSNT